MKKYFLIICLFISNFVLGQQILLLQRDKYGNYTFNPPKIDTLYNEIYNEIYNSLRNDKEVLILSKIKIHNDGKLTIFASKVNSDSVYCWTIFNNKVEKTIYKIKL